MTRTGAIVNIGLFHVKREPSFFNTLDELPSCLPIDYCVAIDGLYWGPIKELGFELILNQ